MKWSDIKNHLKSPQPSRDGNLSSPVQKMEHDSGMSGTHKNTLILLSILAVVVVAGIVLILFNRFHRNDPYMISKNEQKFINEFFVQNPPQPLSADEQKFSQTVAGNTAPISDEEQRFINHLLQGK